MPRRSRDRCSWSIGATTRSSMRPRGARDERHLSVVRDRVPRGPRQGPAGRGACALRGMQQRVCGEPRGGRRGCAPAPASASRSRACHAAARSTAAAPIGPGAPSPPPSPAAPARAPATAPAPGARAATGPARPAAPAPPASPAPPPSPAPAAPRAPAGAAPGQRMTGPLRPVNPFMVQDPKQKARRLARALVSDLVVYHPEKRQQGLRDGTLPQLFKDEIEKSWQEYVDQVGAELAKATSFWAEALNEILAGGNKVF